MTADMRKELVVGQRFTLDLPSNPTTGFDWQVEFPPDRLRLERRKYARGSDRIGAGGTTTFTLGATAPGTATVRFRYLRIWEGHAVDERVVHVRITPSR